MKVTIKGFRKNYNLNVVREIPITDKNRLVEYIKLVGQVNDLYRVGGMDAVKESDYYNIDKTLHLFLSWVDAGISEEMINTLLKNYIRIFRESKVYESYILCLGLGTLLIQLGADTSSIMSYLASLLGGEYLKTNYLRIYSERMKINISGETKITVKFMDFDRTYRKLKYDLLAILSMSKETGGKDLRRIVFKHYPNTDLRVYFSLLDINNRVIADELFRKLYEAPKMDRFLLTAARSLLDNIEIVEMHYLLNSIIGKLTNFDKPYAEVEAEMEMRRKEIQSTIDQG